ncbi:malonyl-ACP O-methyltransferase BioC [Ketobacter sp. MCCC 1A13808]|uniref:malonyl-ACP O-methyltransferase BioC n=1 Tax=Ketobacter sp. MCCC 1A13808 TaxID=2602738 RepID=UPI0012EB5113|nr:malonyl-ACP O-methyltransferase BioC [Ketobacter sp. MCCC 1A13808]MVF14618.1 malonyl-ACP O-methyltransferase BioC [Ketobacter sp. MCCC 1A13808]
MSVNKRAIAKSFSRAATRYDSVAHVQRQVGEAMLSLLEKQGKYYQNALDIGCGTGALTRALSPYADSLTALDIAPGMLAVAQQRDQDKRISRFVCGDAEQLPFPSQCFDLVFSSFALQWCDNLFQVVTDIRALLKPQGRFLFSLPVDGTLCELKQSWAQAEGRHSHVNSFLPVDQVRLALQQSEFNMVAFQERTDQVFYKSVRELTRELKTLGAHQVTSNRTPSLTGKQTVLRMTAAYERLRTESGQLPASWHYVVVCVEK